MTTRLCPPDAATLANECKLGLAQEVFTPSLPILTAPYVRRMDDQARQRISSLGSVAALYQITEGMPGRVTD
jgi:hypothetical protein